MLPTLAALAGVEVPQDRRIDGEDISHLLSGQFEKASAEKAYFYYLHTHLQAVRQGPWKLHLPRPAECPWLPRRWSPNQHIARADGLAGEQPLLFNLENDVREATNLAEEHPDVVKRLLALAETAEWTSAITIASAKGPAFSKTAPVAPGPSPGLTKPAECRDLLRRCRVRARTRARRGLCVAIHSSPQVDVVFDLLHGKLAQA